MEERKPEEQKSLDEYSQRESQNTRPCGTGEVDSTNYGQGEQEENGKRLFLDVENMSRRPALRKRSGKYFHFYRKPLSRNRSPEDRSRCSL